MTRTPIGSHVVYVDAYGNEHPAIVIESPTSGEQPAWCFDKTWATMVTLEYFEEGCATVKPRVSLGVTGQRHIYLNPQPLQQDPKPAEDNGLAGLLGL